MPPRTTRAEQRAIEAMTVNAAVKDEARNGFKRTDPCVTEKQTRRRSTMTKASKEKKPTRTEVKSLQRDLDWALSQLTREWRELEAFEYVAAMTEGLSIECDKILADTICTHRKGAAYCLIRAADCQKALDAVSEPETTR